MDTYLQLIIGVGVSVGLFLIGYRQTVGARRERVRTANTNIEKTLLKRIVLESYTPTMGDIARLIEGKARDHRVRTRDLFSAMQILNILFSRIIESDFITPEQRTKIMERLTPVLIAAEEAPAKEAEVMEITPTRKRMYYRTIIAMTTAVLASLIGALAAFLTKYQTTKLREALASTELVGIFSLSILIIVLIIITLRIRESQEEPGSNQALETAIDFEREVVKTLQKFGVRIYLHPGDRRYDLSTEIKGKKVIIEVKAWAKRIPTNFIRQLVDSLQNILKSEEMDEAIIVTKSSVDFPSDFLKDTHVKIMTLKELRNYLAHK